MSERRKYTVRERRQLEGNPYTYKVTESRLSFTAEFKREFWERYQAGATPRQILADLGYDGGMFTQSQIDALVGRIKKQAASGIFREGDHRDRRAEAGKKVHGQELEVTKENLTMLWNKVRYLEQEVEFIKRIRPAAVHGGKGNRS